MTRQELLEAKPGVCRLLAMAFDIDTKMEPSLRDRLGTLKAGIDPEQDKLIQNIYDTYIEEVADKVLEKCVED